MKAEAMPPVRDYSPEELGDLFEHFLLFADGWRPGRNTAEFVNHDALASTDLSKPLLHPYDYRFMRVSREELRGVPAYTVTGEDAPNGWRAETYVIELDRVFLRKSGEELVDNGSIDFLAEDTRQLSQEEINELYIRLAPLSLEQRSAYEARQLLPRLKRLAGAVLNLRERPPHQAKKH